MASGFGAIRIQQYHAQTIFNIPLAIPGKPAEQLDICRQNAFLKPQHIGTAASLDDRILPIPRGKQVNIITPITLQGIVAQAAIERVVPTASIQQIGPRRTVTHNTRCINHDIEHIRSTQISCVARRNPNAGRTQAAGRAAERSRRRIEVQPRRQYTAVGQGGAVGQRVPCIGISKCSGRNSVDKSIALGSRLIWQCVR